MKKIIAILSLSLFLVLAVSALPSTEHTVTVKLDPASGLVDVSLSINAGDGTVGRFGLEYDAARLVLVDKNGAAVPSPVPDGMTLDSVVTPGNWKILITAENNKTSDLVDPAKGYVLFAWVYSEKDASVTPESGAIASLRFALADGVKYADIRGALRPITEANCPKLSAWNRGMIVLNSENKVFFSFNDNTAATYLKTYIRYEAAPEQPDDANPDETNPDDTKPDETEPDDSKPDDTKPDDTEPDDTKPDDTKPDDTEPDDTEPDDTEPDNTKPEDPKPAAVKTLAVTAETYASGKVLLRWNADGVKSAYFTVTIADSAGNVIRRYDRVADVSRSLLIKDVAPGFAFKATVSAFDASHGKIAEGALDVRTETDGKESSLVVYNVTYDAGEGSLYGFTSELVIFGYTPTKTPIVYAPEGKKFVGWSADGGETVLDAVNLRVYADTALVAVFENA